MLKNYTPLKVPVYYDFMANFMMECGQNGHFPTQNLPSTYNNYIINKYTSSNYTYSERKIHLLILAVLPGTC